MVYGSSLYYGGGFRVRDWSGMNGDSNRSSLGVTSFRTAIANFSAPSVAGAIGFQGPAGGWRGPDAGNDSKIQIRQWSSTAPPWRIAVQGLSLEALCQNSSCRAYGQGYVLVQWGYRNNGSFDVFTNDGDATCPMCCRYVEVRNFGLNNTQYMVTGLKKDNPRAAPQNVNTGWKSASGNYYTTFLDDENSLVNWRQLTLRVRNP